MINYGSYSVDEVFNIMDNHIRGKKAMLPDGQSFRANSSRLKLFRQKGITCVNCGLRANTFVLEAARISETPHMNLYYVQENQNASLNVDEENDSAKFKKAILFTKDHIFPRSLGGLDVMDNYQTMCQTCNARKGSKLIAVGETF